MTHRFSKFTIISLSVFILAEGIPSEVCAIRFGLTGLVEAVVGARAGVAGRFMGTSTKEPAARSTRRSKSPVSRDGTSSPSLENRQQASQSKLPPGLLSLEQRAKLLRIAKRNCNPTLGALDETVSTLRSSSYSLGEAAQAIIALSTRVQSLQNDPDKLQGLVSNHSFVDWLFDAAGWWRGGFNVARNDLLAFSPLSKEWKSLNRINTIFSDTFKALGVPYEGPKELSIETFD